MSENVNVGGSGNFEGYEHILATLKAVTPRLPKGVRLKVERKKYLQFQITIPSKKTRITKSSGCDLTDTGIYAALDKAWKIRRALDEFASETGFWEWYDREVLEKKELIDDRRTYREIFEIIENDYWNSRNRNTKRKRSKDIPNDLATFNDYYGSVFKKFSDWNKQPNWEEIKQVLFSWEQGTKRFKDAYAVIKRICSMSPNADKLLGLLSEVDSKQTSFKARQSISLNKFLAWRTQTLENATTERNLEIRKSGLWVCSMCVVYGLRPSEVAAIENLTKSYTKDGVTIPALNKQGNKELLIVLGDRTYFGTTVKTGGRVCRPLILDKTLIEELEIQVPRLPTVDYKTDKEITLVGTFAHQLRRRMIEWKCPVTEAYAFRHLGNQLGEQYGIPQEIRARSLGHSTIVNESVYKKRTNFQTSVDLLTKHAKQPLDYQTTCYQLERLGFDLNDESVRAILRVIYQLES